MTLRHSASEAFFLPGQSGQLFAIYYPPVESLANPLSVLLVPPFAEEMNKSRRMFAVLAAQLAASGIGVLSIDLFGSGDSAGDFCEARWDVWLDNIERGIAFLRQRNGPRIAALGLRAGALLALDVQRRQRDCFSAMVLWQPTLNGATLMAQFLRLKVAADRLENHPQATTTTMLRTALEQGQILEIAGYTLHPALFESISACNVESADNALTIPVHWFELSAQQTALASAATLRSVEAWRGVGVNISLQVLQGPSFWDTQEITLVPALIDHTVSLLSAL